MKKALFILIFLLSAAPCLAGTAPQPDDWDKKHADKPYVVLFSSHRVDLNKDGSYTEYLHWTEKIQNERGMSEGEIPVTYNKNNQVIKRISAYTITPERKKYRYKMIQDIDTSSEGDYSDYRQKIVTMPHVTPGSIIDFKMEVFNSQDVIKGEYFNLMDLFYTTPAKYRIRVLTAPQDIPLHFKKINTLREPQAARKDGKVTYTWEFKGDEIYNEDIEKEIFTPPYIDFMPYMCISTMNDWHSFAAWYWREFSKNTASSDEIKAAVAGIIKGKSAPEDRITAIGKYLYENFRYIEMALGNHNFEPHPATEVFRNKFGDCKDQTALFIAMLKEAGVEACPVLICDAGYGNPVNLLPDPGHFHHVIAMAKTQGKLYFIDPLAEGYRPDEITDSLEGDYGLIVDGGEGRFVQLPLMDVTQKTNIDKKCCRLSEDGSSMTELELRLDRRESISMRKRIKLETELSKQRFLEYLESATNGGKLINYSTEGLKDEYGLLTNKLKAFQRQLVKPHGRIMILGVEGVDLSSAFPFKERKYPLWLFGEWESIKTTEYVIPEGFGFEYIPPNARFDSEWVDICVTYTRKGRHITQNINKHFKRSLTPPQRYKEFKDFLRKADNELEECIIIRRQNGLLGQLIAAVKRLWAQLNCFLGRFLV